MDMFCFQCQETLNNQGCTIAGVCGKTSEVANLQDVLIDVLKGISIYGLKAQSLQLQQDDVPLFVAKMLFTTITNVNFDPDFFVKKIQEALHVRDQLAVLVHAAPTDSLPDAATWSGTTEEDFLHRAELVSILATPDVDVRSLRELLIYGIKGIAAYIEHAAVLNEKSSDVLAFLLEGLAATTDDFLTADDLVALILKAGNVAVQAMAILDKANTEAFGHPEPTQVNIGVRNRPGILISGHDLKDLEELLEQTEGTGVDVYTHGEMLPANSYPKFKKFEHFVGNYGNAWQEQGREFDLFNGPILMTTNCLIPPKTAYRDRIYTTGVVGFPDIAHVADREPGKAKDFSLLIKQALKCEAPTAIETGTIPGGFAHQAVLSVADKVIEAVKTGAIKRFVVMGGCEGRHTSRQYYSQVAEALPKDTVILTAGCAKFRYNKLNLGDIGGIPRILDAGQCNDSYSLVVIALALAEAFGVKDINELPISFDIAWYEQKAVAVLLALLSLGVKGIRLGPTLPAFISPNVLNVLVDKFHIQPISTPAEDIEAMIAL